MEKPDIEGYKDFIKDCCEIPINPNKFCESWGCHNTYQLIQYIEHLEKVIKAQNKLLICYRLGGQPEEWVFNILAEYKSKNPK